MSLTIDVTAGSDNGATGIGVINCSDLRLNWSPSFDNDDNCLAGYAGDGTPFTQEGGSPYISVDGTYGPISAVYSIGCDGGQLGISIDFSDGNNLFLTGGITVTTDDCCTTTLTLDGTTHAQDDDASTALWIDSNNIGGTISYTVQNNHCCNNGDGCQIGTQACDGTCTSSSSSGGFMLRERIAAPLLSSSSSTPSPARGAGTRGGCGCNRNRN